MKIGKFASTNKLSIDTIRHYMDLGLILPEKQGGQYFFDSKCQKDLEDIINLKAIGFSLSEIKTIFFYKSFGNLTPYETDIYYKTLFMEKYRNLEADIKKLQTMKDNLQFRLDAMSEKPLITGKEHGIDLRNLSLFCCLNCKGNLMLKDGTISNNQIINGKLSCHCGEEYTIESGILNIDNYHRASSVHVDINYITEYINVTDASYLDNLYKGLEWANRKIDSCNLENKVLLELGTGIGFFLRSIYNKLPDNCTYIAVDHDFEMHKFLKSLLERNGITKNVIFICSDFLRLPIKERTVDFLLDISGTSNYSFEHEEFLLSLIDWYIRSDSYLLASYITFKNFSGSSLVEKKYRKNFTLKNIKEEISRLGYQCLEDRASNSVDKGGRYESYFVPGEKIYNYSFFGKR